MKQQNIKQTTYDTTWTELAATLRALGFELIKGDPMRRIFSDRKPPNPEQDFRKFTSVDERTGRQKDPRTGRLYDGLQRGGDVQYRFGPKSDEFPFATIGRVAQAYAAPLEISARESNEFDDKMNELREKLKGTEAGIMFDAICMEFPLEIARYCRVATDDRRENLEVIRDNPTDEETGERREIVELVRIQKDDGNFILHHFRCPAETVEALNE